jgi:glutamine phosphoribosylpyrophosphate amidotransferase
LAYLSLDALKEATGAPRAGFCDACLTGNYPVPVTMSVVDRDALDEVRIVEHARDLSERPVEPVVGG